MAALKLDTDTASSSTTSNGCAGVPRSWKSNPSTGPAHRMSSPNTGRNTVTMMRMTRSTSAVRPAWSPAAKRRATAGAKAVSIAPESMLAGVATDTAIPYRPRAVRVSWARPSTTESCSSPEAASSCTEPQAVNPTIARRVGVSRGTGLGRGQEGSAKSR